ncbi:hypothetical protein BU15DRAFT_63946 [Melanogaster broomeanus]|nr:hypothetical protein BU15DRAFT_63946 [Melanogaster broomeanus]
MSGTALQGSPGPVRALLETQTEGYLSRSRSTSTTITFPYPKGPRQRPPSGIDVAEHSSPYHGQTRLVFPACIDEAAASDQYTGSKDFSKQPINPKSQDATLASDVREVERRLKRNTVAARGVLQVGAVSEVLYFGIDHILGNGPCTGRGAGSYVGPVIPASVATALNGTYRLTFGTQTATLHMYNSAGVNIFTYIGRGSQSGLSNKNGQPWVGKFNSN